MARMVVISAPPAAPAAFDRHCFEAHVPLARQLPDVRRYEVSRGPVASLADAGPAHLVASLHFDDMASLRAAFASPAGRACAQDRKRFAPDGAGVQMFLFEDAPV